jgi:ribosome-associated translation inhibitor RaiA
MNFTQITLRNLRRSTALSARIRELADRLEQRYPAILNCRVAVAQDTARTPMGRMFHVTVRVRLKGRELVASHEHRDDVYVALRDAFEAMRRQLIESAAAPREVARRLPKTNAEVQP